VWCFFRPVSIIRSPEKHPRVTLFLWFFTGFLGNFLDADFLPRISRRFFDADCADYAELVSRGGRAGEAKLTKQPIPAKGLLGQAGCKLEYRVKAINPSGESMPSNTVGVVL
jgi:hypothetical protein